jgi:hypothetical protein
MSIWLPTYQETVQLNQGSFQRDGGEDSLYVNLLEPFATGDLNGDGVDDLAVLVAENGGGSGTFVSLITFFNQDGQPVQQPGVLIDDRPLINDLSIQDQKIIVKATIHSANDPACCPAWDVTETYAVDSSSALALWSLKSMTPTIVNAASKLIHPMMEIPFRQSSTLAAVCDCAFEMP